MSLRQIITFVFIMALTQQGLSQWTFQVSAGYALGSDAVSPSTRFGDTLEASFIKKAVGNYLFGVSAFYRINEKWRLRSGLDVTKTFIDFRADADESSTWNYLERRVLGDIHLPIQAEYHFTKWFAAQMGFSVKYAFHPEAAKFNAIVREEDLFFQGTSDEARAEYRKIYDAMRSFTFDYRVGVTFTPIKNVHFDFMRDVIITDRIRPLNLTGQQREADVKYGIWMIQLGYEFEWKKMKERFNR